MSADSAPPRLENLMSTNAIEPEGAPFETIGGSKAKIVRRPSVLTGIPEKGLGALVGRSCSSSPGDSDGSTGRKSTNGSILRWQEYEVLSWLEELGFEQYSVGMGDI